MDSINSYNKHYIRIDDNKNIIYGFSTDFENPLKNDICINKKGGRAFKLFIDGVEYPILKDINGIYLYQYINNKIIKKSEKNIQEEINNLPQKNTLSKIDELQIGLAELAEILLGGQNSG